jgi:hypothetical protein
MTPPISTSHRSRCARARACRRASGSARSEPRALDRPRSRTCISGSARPERATPTATRWHSCRRRPRPARRSRRPQRSRPWPSRRRPPPRRRPRRPLSRRHGPSLERFPGASPARRPHPGGNHIGSRRSREPGIRLPRSGEHPMRFTPGGRMGFTPGGRVRVPYPEARESRPPSRRPVGPGHRRLVPGILLGAPRPGPSRAPRPHRARRTEPIRGADRTSAGRSPAPGSSSPRASSP